MFTLGEPVSGAHSGAETNEHRASTPDIGTAVAVANKDIFNLASR